MRLFVISDIHGSFTALNRALDIYKKGDYDKIIICGDILYHGARNPLPDGYSPKDVLSLLNSYKKEIIAIRGNCESEVDATVLEFPITADYSYYNLLDRDIFITHGHIFSQDNLPPIKDGSLFLSGHTHIPTASKVGELFLLNPGSISLPKGGFEPTYGVLTSLKWEVRDLKTEKILLSTEF